MGETPQQDRTRETLGAFAVHLLDSLAQDWGGVLGTAVHRDAPSLLRPPESLPRGQDLWPALVTQVELSSPTATRLAMVTPFQEASAFFGVSEGSGGIADEAVEVLAEVFAMLASATDRAFRKEISLRYRVRGCTSHLASSLEEMSKTGLAADGPTLRLVMTAKDGRRVHLWVVLPQALSVSMVAERQRSGRSPRPSTVVTSLAPGTCVMVVDNQILIRRILRWTLEKQGYRVIEASGGQEALQQLTVHKPALVILDLAMPQMNGIELCRRIRGYPQYKALPIIFCSARHTRDDVTEAIRAGAQDYVLKPVKKEILLEKVARVLASHQTQGLPGSTQAPPPEQATP